MEKSEKITTGLALFISSLIAIVFYWLINKTMPIVYAINDDVAMRDIAAGAITGEPDGHLIFIKYAFGFLLSQMYSFVPGFDWYGIAMTGLIMVSLAVILYRGLADISKVYWKIFYMVVVIFVFVCVGLQHVVVFQWTVTAAITGATGVFLFYTSSGDNRLKTHVEEFVAVLLLIIAFCIRTKIFIMLLPMAGICFLFKYVEFDRQKKICISIRHLGVPIALFLCCAVVILIERKAYQSEDWKTYKEYNLQRSAVYDYYGIPEYEGNEAFYNSIDMGSEDVKILEAYSLIFMDDISNYKMKEIAEYAKNLGGDARTSFFQRIVEGLDRVYSDFKLNEYEPLIWLVLITSILAFKHCSHKSNKQIYLCIACLVVQTLLWWYLGIQGRIVDRVSFGMHLYVLLLYSAILFKDFQEDGPQEYKINISQCFLIAFCGMILIGSFVSEWKEAGENASEIEAMNMEYIEMCRYMGEHPENVYLLQVDAFAQFTDDFHIRRNFSVENFIDMGGWTTLSPVEVKKQQILGISDVKTALKEKENVYVVSVSIIPTDYLVDYLKKETGSCHSELVDTIAYLKYYYTVEKFSE